MADAWAHDNPTFCKHLIALFKPTLSKLFAKLLKTNKTPPKHYPKLLIEYTPFYYKSNPKSFFFSTSLLQGFSLLERIIFYIILGGFCTRTYDTPHGTYDMPHGT